MALAKELLASGMGALISLPSDWKMDEEILFGEGGPRAIYAVASEGVAAFRQLWEGWPLDEIGVLGGSRLRVDNVLNLSCDDLAAAWKGEN